MKLIKSVELPLDKMQGVEVYIEEVISNLLANSIKYTPSNGTVKFDVTGDADSVLIRIEDTGIGIPKESLPKIFDEFYRAPNAKRSERDGTGLGLSIAKQVVELHKGEIWVESEEGKGSIFSVMLPR